MSFTLPMNMGLMKKMRYEIDNVCAYCGELMIEGTIDHILPKSSGGSNELHNLLLCCRECNADKGRKRLEHWRPGHENLVSTLSNVAENAARMRRVLVCWFESRFASVSSESAVMFEEHVEQSNAARVRMLCDAYDVGVESV